jgi:hypothetical protein
LNLEIIMSLFDRCFRWLTRSDSLPSNEQQDATDSEKCNRPESKYREVCDSDAENIGLRLDRASDNCDYDINDDVHIMNSSSTSNKNPVDKTQNNLIKMNKNNSEKSSSYVSKLDGSQIRKECNSSFIDLMLSTRNNISSRIQQGRNRAVETISNMCISDKSDCSSSSRSACSSKSCDAINNMHRIAFENPRVPECVICLVEFSKGK